MFLMRFDMRCPDPSASQALYETALEMARWGEEKGCIQLVVSEHHGSPDGYLPSPLILAAGSGCTNSGRGEPGTDLISTCTCQIHALQRRRLV